MSKDFVLYFKVDVKNMDVEEYLDFRRDLYEACKVNPVYENIDKTNGVFNIYVPDIRSGLIFKGKFMELKKKYKNFLI